MKLKFEKRFYLMALVLSVSLAANAQELYKIPQGTTSHLSSMENLNGPKGKGGMTNHGGKGKACVPLEPGQTLTMLDVKGSGMIQRFWITIWDRSPEMLRGTRLKIYWDGATTPAVDVPLGDYFCQPFGQTAGFENALFSTAEGRSFNSYIPMPFRKGARMTVTNETNKEQIMFFYDVDFIKTAKPDPAAFYFHASWTRQDHKPVPQDIDLLPKVIGKGRFLGVSVGLNADPVYGDTWWGEGEVKLYMDGDTKYPTINGTGSEDYLGSGWMLGTFVNRYQGCLTADAKKNQYVFYRFHIPDQIIFNHDFHATIQQLGGGPAGTVRALQAKGVSLRPVNVSNSPAFTGLLDSKGPAGELAKANPNDWVCFNRSDDYAVTAYYYLDRP